MMVTLVFKIFFIFFSADLTIYAGDFNTEPKDIPYKLGNPLY